MTSQVARNNLEDDAPRAAASSIFVANIPWMITEEELTQFFSEFGEVTRVRLRGFFSLAVSFQLCFS
jgi:RNA recognition motif-containing protein